MFLSQQCTISRKAVNDFFCFSSKKFILLSSVEFVIFVSWTRLCRPGLFHRGIKINNFNQDLGCHTGFNCANICQNIWEQKRWRLGMIHQCKNTPVLLEPGYWTSHWSCGEIINPLTVKFRRWITTFSARNKNVKNEICVLFLSLKKKS